MMRRLTRFGRDDARVLVWRGATLKMNENSDKAEIAEAYEEDPVAAATEFGAEFRDDLSGFIARGGRAPSDGGQFELPALPGQSYQTCSAGAELLRLRLRPPRRQSGGSVEIAVVGRHQREARWRSRKRRISGVISSSLSSSAKWPVSSKCNSASPPLKSQRTFGP